MNRRLLLPLLFLAALLAVVLVPPFLRGESGFFWSADNLRFLAAQGGWLTLGALAMLLMVTTAGIDLSAAAIIALAGSAAALRLAHGESATMALLAALGVGTAAGVIHGVLRIVPRCPFMLITLATGGVAAALAEAWRPDGALPETWLGHLPAPYPTPAFLLVAPVFWIALLLALFAVGLMRTTALGVHWLAIGSNEKAARLCGVPVHRRRMLAMLLSGWLLALMGAMQAGQLRAAPPVSSTLLLELITAALVGRLAMSGTGKVALTVLTALVLTFFRNAAQQAGWPLWPQTLLVALLMLGAAALPRGVQDESGETGTGFTG